MFGDLKSNPYNWECKKLLEVADIDTVMVNDYEKYADYPHIGIDSIEKNYGLKIGHLTAEYIKCEIGSLFEHDSMRVDVNGRDVYTGKPRAISIGSEDIRRPIQLFFDKIFEITEMLMAKLSAEVSAEIRQSGIFFAGGSSKIPGLSDYATEKLLIRTTCFENPENATVLGGGIVAGDKHLLKKLKLIRK